MKRKLAALLAAITLASAFVACGGGTQTPASQPGAPASQAAPLEPTEAPTTTDAIKRGGVLTTSRLGITPLNPTKYIAMQGDKIIEGFSSTAWSTSMKRWRSNRFWPNRGRSPRTA